MFDVIVNWMSSFRDPVANYWILFNIEKTVQVWVKLVPDTQTQIFLSNLKRTSPRGPRVNAVDFRWLMGKSPEFRTTGHPDLLFKSGSAEKCRYGTLTKTFRYLSHILHDFIALESKLPKDYK